MPYTIIENGAVTGLLSGPSSDPACTLIDANDARITAYQLAAAIKGKQASVDFYKANRFATGYLDAGSGKHFAVDTDNRTDLAAIVAFAQLAGASQAVWGSPWNTKIAVDGSTITFNTAADAISFAASLGAWYGNTTLHAPTLKAQIAALTTIAEVNNFDITQGWP